jgi:hypothetical protein
MITLLFTFLNRHESWDYEKVAVVLGVTVVVDFMIQVGVVIWLVVIWLVLK